MYKIIFNIVSCKQIKQNCSYHRMNVKTHYSTQGILYKLNKNISRKLVIEISITMQKR